MLLYLCILIFFFNDTATTQIYTYGHTLSLHDALPIFIKRQLLLGATGTHGEKLSRGERILVCSAHPGEGKTFCAINLALSMAAEKDVQVLLVDADFAKRSEERRVGKACVSRCRSRW